MLKDRCVNELGFEQVNIDNVGNIIATKGTGEPCILLCGHMDTVPSASKDRGWLHLRVEELTQNLRWYPCSLAASEFPKQSGTVIFTGVVDEEGNATGVKQLVKSKIESIMRSLANRLELITSQLHTREGLPYGLHAMWARAPMRAHLGLPRTQLRKCMTLEGDQVRASPRAPQKITPNR